MHDFEYQIAISIFVFQFSIFGFSLFFMLLWSKTFFSIQEHYQISDFQFQNSLLMHDFEYQNTILIFIFRFSIFRLSLFFTLSWSKTYFGIRNELNFRFTISKLTLMNKFYDQNALTKCNKKEIASSIHSVNTSNHVHKL